MWLLTCQCPAHRVTWNQCLPHVSIHVSQKNTRALLQWFTQLMLRHVPCFNTSVHWKLFLNSSIGQCSVLTEWVKLIEIAQYLDVIQRWCNKQLSVYKQQIMNVDRKNRQFAYYLNFRCCHWKCLVSQSLSW